MKPQPYNRKKRFFLELSRTQVLFSIAGALIILSWVFILGIFVGRGYVSDTISQTFSDQIQKLQQEKKALMDKYLAQEKKGDVPSEEILKPQLDFYDKLSQKETGNTQLTVPKPTPKPAPGGEKTEAAPKPAPKEAKEESKGPQPESKVSKGLQESSVETGGFMVQIGSYREEETAQHSVKRLQGKGYPAALRAKEIPEKGGKWFRVQVGPFKTKEEAEKMVKKLGHDGFQSVVLEKKK
jgi:cell division protein FtsN